MKDIKLTLKKGENWGEDKIDWEVKGGMLQTIENTNPKFYEQVLKKSLLSPIYDFGYGVSIWMLRGKSPDVTKMIGMSRIIRNMIALEAIYGCEFKPERIAIENIEKDQIKIEILLDIAQVELVL